MAGRKASSRTAARKLKDRWRSKSWYRVLAPDMFEGVQIGETLADDPKKIKGRILDVTLQQLTGDFSKMHIKLLFKINSVRGSDAYSDFIGHDLTSDYIRRLTRRKRSKMDGIYDVITKDGFKIRVKPFAVTEKRIQTAQQYAIRMKMKNVVERQAGNKIASEFIRQMLSGELSSMIFKECKPIYPIKRVEIRRSQILEVPEGGFTHTPPKPETEDSEGAGEGAKETEEPKGSETKSTADKKKDIVADTDTTKGPDKAPKAKAKGKTKAKKTSTSKAKTAKKPRKTTKKSTTAKSTKTTKKAK